MDQLLCATPTAAEYSTVQLMRSLRCRHHRVHHRVWCARVCQGVGCAGLRMLAEIWQDVTVNVLEIL